MINGEWITRRALLRVLGGAAAFAALPASPARAAVTCPNACRSLLDADDGWAAGLPIIDAHCHIFNARDIPAARFIAKVFLPSYSSFLKDSYQERLQREITAYMSATLGSTPGYQQERALLEARLAGEPAAALFEEPALPAFAKGRDKSCYGRDVADNISAVRNLVTILSGFRHRNLEALAATYETGLENVGIALFTPAMVDMDYWLGPDHDPTVAIGDVGADAFSLPQTTIPQQIELMEMVQRLFPGRCHAFVSFCPWRQVDDEYHNAHSHAGAPPRPTALDNVKDAILNRGFAGVKLYPPMGFLPIGNSELPLEAFPSWAADAHLADRFGTALDEALRGLYRFCAEHDVAIMAHCAATNGAGTFKDADGRKETYAVRAHPFGWARLLAEPEFAGLRLNLAHFGSARGAGETERWRAVIGQLMDTHDHVYSDLSHYAEMVLDNFTGSGQHCREAAELLEPLRKRFLAQPAGNKRVARLLYGSDWSMLSKEFYYADYLAVAAHMYRRKIYGVGRGAEKNARGFLAGNAVRFLGLGKGGPLRKRLDGWYEKNGLNPALLARFDGLDT